MLRILTDRGTDYSGRADRRDYQLFLAINDIDHTKTRAKRPQTNGICERFHKTCQDEYYSIACRKKIYVNVEEVQADHDAGSSVTTANVPIKRSARRELPSRHSKTTYLWQSKSYWITMKENFRQL